MFVSRWLLGSAQVALWVPRSTQRRMPATADKDGLSAAAVEGEPDGKAGEDGTEDDARHVLETAAA